MRTRSVLRRFMLLIVLLMHHEDHLAAGNEETCKSKMNHDAYMHRNDLSCQDDALDNNFSFIQRYKSTRSCTPDFDVTDTLKYQRKTIFIISLRFNPCAIDMRYRWAILFLQLPQKMSDDFLLNRGKHDFCHVEFYSAFCYFLLEFNVEAVAILTFTIANNVFMGAVIPDYGSVRRFPSVFALAARSRR
nr:PREDICTED: uncharacterized protein LOC105678384 [Linepithema humile]